MAIHAPDSSRASGEATQVLEGLQYARAHTLALVAHLDDSQLQRVYSPIMSPLVWDLGHIAAYEDLWISHRLGGRALLRPELAALYDAFETPRAVRGEIEKLGPPAAREYLAEVRARSTQTLAEHGAGDGTICEMVIRHELQHGETMRQTLAIAALLGESDARRAQQPLASAAAEDAAWIEVPAGSFAMGAAAEGFAYDNERPRHERHVSSFQIARLPSTNEDWLRFAEQGGYRRRELWSPQGWAWLAEQELPQHPAIAAGNPHAPACHVSFFEAEAFARAAGARLPSEAEWEKAATTSALDGVGRAWEWTHSHFDRYPGFLAHPYREYSEVFFGKDYRVLRGGSWATDPRVAGVRFRNWDLPPRRQIFAGARLARDRSEGGGGAAGTAR